MANEALLDDVLGPLALPRDRPLTTFTEVAARALAETGLHHVVGVEGSAPAWVAKALAAGSDRKVVYVAPDLDTARRAAADLRALAEALPLRGALASRVHGTTLLYEPPEAGPYAEHHPDRRVVMGRAATLFRLATRSDWRFLVVPAPALLRKVVPADVLRAGGLRLELEGELDLEDTCRRLTEAGYLRVPVVEDAGSFAVRGGLLDVWPPGDASPLRVELYGDFIERFRRFDPDTQRTREEPAAPVAPPSPAAPAPQRGATQASAAPPPPPSESLRVVELPPAREAIATPAATERARAVVRSLCDAVNLPSSQARRFVDEVASGTSFFGADAFLPAFSELVPLWTMLPRDALFVVEGPIEATGALDAERRSAEHAVAAREGTPHFPMESLYASEEELGELLGSRSVVVTHRSGVAGGDADGALERLQHAPEGAPTLATHDHADLARAVKTARTTLGKHAGLDPLLRRLAVWREAGLDVVLAARVSTQAERVAALLSHREIGVARWVAGEAPARGAVVVITSGVARGLLAPAEGFVLVTEEEIFGQRAHRRAAPKRSARALLADLRELAVGDFVVHVEQGVGRYLGLEHRVLDGVTVDLIAVEYAGGDRLYLPVHRLNQIQKYSGGEGAPRLDRLGGQSFGKTKAKVRKRVREMADELLRLYAERQARRKTPLGPPDDDYAAFEATFPFEETADQAAAITEVNRDLESDAVMDRLVCGDVGFGKTEVAVRAAFRMALAGRQVAVLCPTTVLAQQHFRTFSERVSGYPVEVRVLSRFVSSEAQRETLKDVKLGKVDIVVGTHRLLSRDVHFKNLGLLVVDEEQRFGVAHKERIKQLRTSVDVLTLSATPIPRTLQMAIGGLRDMSLVATPPVDRRAVRTITARHDDALIRDAIRRELSRGGQVFYVYNRVEGIYERAARVQQLVPEARVAVGHGQLAEGALEKAMVGFVEGDTDVLVATAIIESGLDIPRANTMLIDRADMFGLSQLYQLRGRVGRSSERAYCYLLVPPPQQMTDEARSRVEALERYSDLGAGFHVASLDMELRGAGDFLSGEQSGFVAGVGFDLFCQMLEEATEELRGGKVTPELDPELHVDVEALLPESYVAEVGVRLTLYKRLASAVDEAEVAELGSEMEDRFGEAPLAARHLIELMRLKTELRRLRVLGCQATARSVTLHLCEDTPLDPAAIGKLVADRKRGYALTPDMRLTRRALATEVVQNGLVLADRLLDELRGCLRADG